MGNEAFLRHLAHLQRLPDPQRREAVRTRFRAAFLLASPFCLHLQSRRVTSVAELLRLDEGRGLARLGLPAALLTQLEVLLSSVVGRAAHAKTVPVPRGRLASARGLFASPLLYDPRFQRSPLDPFGRPPRLASAPPPPLALQSVPSSLSISSDLTEPPSLWDSNHSPPVDSRSPSHQDLWGFRAVLPDLDEASSQDSKEEASVISSPVLPDNGKVRGDVDPLAQRDRSDLRTLLQSPSEPAPTYRVLCSQAPSDLRVSSYLQPPPSTAVSRDRPNLSPQPSKSRQDHKQPFVAGLEKCCSHSFRCTHPKCNQVFSRLFTYKMHLKSHETFPQYHEFKQRPQLVLDMDRQQAVRAQADMHSQKLSLPPIIRSQLNSLGV